MLNLCGKTFQELCVTSHLTTPRKFSVSSNLYNMKSTGEEHNKSFPCSFSCTDLLLFEGNVKDGSSKQKKSYMTNDKQWNTFKNLKSKEVYT